MSILNIADFNDMWLEATATVDEIIQMFDINFNEPGDMLQLALRLQFTPPEVMQLVLQQDPQAMDKIHQLFGGNGGM